MDLLGGMDPGDSDVVQPVTNNVLISNNSQNSTSNPINNSQNVQPSLNSDILDILGMLLCIWRRKYFTGNI